MYIDLENTLAAKMEEHELLESQFTMEHEEEVRALRQQKQQLMQQLEESKGHYQNILDDQEQQVASLTNKSSYGSTGSYAVSLQKNTKITEDYISFVASKITLQTTTS